jgi:hypothetical protein
VLENDCSLGDQVVVTVGDFVTVLIHDGCIILMLVFDLERLNGCAGD